AGDGKAPSRCLVRVVAAVFWDQKAELPCGVVVLTLDLAARLNQAPDRLAFLTDDAGKLLATPGTFCFENPAEATDCERVFRVSPQRGPNPDQTLDPSRQPGL